MHIIRQIFVLFGLLGLATGAYADSPPPGRFTVGRYLDLQSAGSPQISPDGAQILYTRTVVDKQQDKSQSTQLYMLSWFQRFSGTPQLPDLQ
jgi:hypothetical protein